MASIGAWSLLDAEIRRRVFLSGLLFAQACTPGDWQQEEVLGEDLSTIVIAGEPGSALGSALAMGEPGLLVGSEGAGRVQAFDLQGEELWCATVSSGTGIRLGWTENGAWVWQRGQGYTLLNDRGEVIEESPETLATAVDRCPDGRFEEVTSPGASLSCAAEGLIWTRCSSGDCEVLVEQDVIAHTSPGSAVGWMDGHACWGDVDFEQPDAGGSAHCMDGWSLDGMTGEHLGSVLRSGRVAGQFSKWSIPARARVLDRQQEAIWAIDRAAERSRLSLAEYQGRWAVGVAGYMGEEAQEGRVYIVVED